MVVRTFTATRTLTYVAVLALIALAPIYAFLEGKTFDLSRGQSALDLTHTLARSLSYTFIVTGLQIVGAVAFVRLVMPYIRKKPWFVKYSLVALLLAYVTPPTITVALAKVMLAPKGPVGLLTSIVNPVKAGYWLQNGEGLDATLAVLSTFQYLPFAAAILILSLYRIPSELFAVARLDGIPPHRVFVEVVWPHLKNATLVLIAVRLVLMFGKSEIPFAFMDSLQMLPIRLYNTLGNNFEAKSRQALFICYGFGVVLGLVTYGVSHWMKAHRRKPRRWPVPWKGKILPWRVLDPLLFMLGGGVLLTYLAFPLIVTLCTFVKEDSLSVGMKVSAQTLTSENYGRFWSHHLSHSLKPVLITIGMSAGAATLAVALSVMPLLHIRFSWGKLLLPIRLLAMLAASVPPVSLGLLILTSAANPTLPAHLQLFLGYLIIAFPIAFCVLSAAFETIPSTWNAVMVLDRLPTWRKAIFLIRFRAPQVIATWLLCYTFTSADVMLGDRLVSGNDSLRPFATFATRKLQSPDDSTYAQLFLLGLFLFVLMVLPCLTVSRYLQQEGQLKWAE